MEQKTPIQPSTFVHVQLSGHYHKCTKFAIVMVGSYCDNRTANFHKYGELSSEFLVIYTFWESIMGMALTATQADEWMMACRTHLPYLQLRNFAGILQGTVYFSFNLETVLWFKDFL